MRSFDASAAAVIDFLTKLGYQIEPVDRPSIDLEEENDNTTIYAVAK